MSHGVPIVLWRNWACYRDRTLSARAALLASLHPWLPTECLAFMHQKKKLQRNAPNKTRYAASWSSGRVQDSGLGFRSSPEFNTLPVRLLVVPLSKALHAALLLSTQAQSGYLWGQICKPWRQVACERLYTPQGVEMDIQMDMECKGPMTREGTCQSLQSRALSLDVDSKQWLYLLPNCTVGLIFVIMKTHRENNWLCA